MSLFSKKPKNIADFEKEIEKLRQKKNSPPAIPSV